MCEYRNMGVRSQVETFLYKEGPGRDGLPSAVDSDKNTGKPV